MLLLFVPHKYLSYMRAASGLSWRREVLSFASRHLAPKTVGLSVHFIRVLFNYLLVSERGGRWKPSTGRSASYSTTVPLTTPQPMPCFFFCLLYNFFRAWCVLVHPPFYRTIVKGYYTPPQTVLRLLYFFGYRTFQIGVNTGFCLLVCLRLSCPSVVA